MNSLPPRQLPIGRAIRALLGIALVFAGMFFTSAPGLMKLFVPLEQFPPEFDETRMATIVLGIILIVGGGLLYFFNRLSKEDQESFRTWSEQMGGKPAGTPPKPPEDS